MDLIHYIGQGGPICGVANASWCTALAETVTCRACRRLLAAAGVRSADASAPRSGDAPPSSRSR
jgi:hypothetical protein